MLDIHRKATEFAMANKDAMVDDGGAEARAEEGSDRASVANVELTWRSTTGDRAVEDLCPAHARDEADQQLPDFATFFDTALRRRELATA